MIREPFVAGQFYPANPSSLLAEVDSYLKGEEDIKEVDPGLIMAPHAGYMYSGRIAGETFSRARIPHCVILLGPNHTGIGASLSLWNKGIWKMPLGEVSINEEVAQELLSASNYIQPDYSAHLREHSLEVLLPFLWRKNPSLTIVPLSIMETDPSVLIEVGKEISRVMGERKDICLVVSSDMSHFIPHNRAVKLDKMAIDAILEIDPLGLFETVRKNHITMCGVLPMTVGLSCVKALGYTRAEMVGYATSGEITGDMERVVGYAGIVIY